MHILVLAGGGGTRLWPLSRQDFPKQFLHFGEPLSLLQKTVSRFLHFPLTKTLSISTNVQHESLVRQQLAKIDPDLKVHVIVEPDRKNTAPAIAFSLRYLQERAGVGDGESVLVLPSDHLIEPEAVFTRYLEMIEPLSKKEQIVIFGIRPTKPETGFGYIHLGEKYDFLSYRVKRFVEKPTRAVAESYLASGDYYWNAGMFVFTAGLFWKKLSELAPAIYALSKDSLNETHSRFSAMPDISFDYAILEKSPEILVCPLPVSWSDVGSWDSVYEVMKKDRNQNVKFGNVLDIDTKNSLIFGGKRLISTIGLEDMLIVETDDATFISKKGESQKVKEIVQELQKMGSRKGTDHTSKQHSWGTAQLLEEKKGYSVQKISLLPGQFWECRIPSSLTLLEGKVCVEGEELFLRVPFSIEEGKCWIFKNNGNETAQLLWVSGHSFFD